MGAKLKAIFVILFLFSAFLHSKKISYADNDTEGVFCSISINNTAISTNPNSSSPISPASQDNNGGLFQIKVCGDQGSAANQQPKIAIDTPGVGAWAEFPLIPDGTGCYNSVATLNVGTPTTMALDVESSTGVPICRRVYASLQGGSPLDQKLWDDSLALMCQFAVSPSSNITSSTPVTISSVTTAWFQQRQVARFFKNPQGQLKRFRFHLMRAGAEIFQESYANSPSGVTYSSTLGVATYNYEIRESATDSTSVTTVCGGSFTVGTPQNPGGVQATSGNVQGFALCDQAANSDDKIECQKCVTGGAVGENTITDPNTQGYWTAFGCVKTSKEGIVTSFVRIGLGISGGFVLLSILYGAFLITTSSGDPKRVQEGQEMVTSAVMGLIFVIFSIIILRFIGVSLLRIPGFGT